MRSAAEWEDEIYMTKFRLIKELYQGGRRTGFAQRVF